MIDNDLLPLWELVQIGDLCEPIETIDPRKGGVATFKYVDISSVDNERKTIVRFNEIESVNAPSRARQRMAMNDVLVSTVRPNLNAVALVPSTLNDEICSTGFCVLRAKPDILEPEYLFAWARHPAFILSLIQSERGIGYPAVSDGDVKRTRIPLPPPSEQRRIVAILRQADELRRLRRQANERTQDLLPALFEELFGGLDSEQAPRKFRKLSDIADVVQGVAKGRKFGKKKTVIVPYLRVANVQAGYLDLTEIKTIEVLPEDVERYRLVRGDVLVTEGGDFDKLGRGAIWEDQVPNCIHQNHIFRIRPEKGSLLPEFLEGLLQTAYARSYFLRAAKKTTNLASINLSQLRNFPVPRISTAEQGKYVIARESIKRNETLQERALTSTENLFQSLLADAFSGELTAGWREGRAEALAREAEEMRKRLEELKQPARITIEIVGAESLAQTMSKIQEITKSLAQTLPPMSDILPDLALSLNLSNLIPVQEYIKTADLLKPFTEEMSEAVSQMLQSQMAEVQKATTEAFANLTAPLIDHWREAMQPYYADLTATLSQIAQLILDQPLTRADIQEAILETIEEQPEKLPRYWTLKNLTGDWRFNHLPRTTLQEAVDMLVVLGQLRPASLRRETDDPQNPAERIEAYTRVTDRDLATPADIQL